MFEFLQGFAYGLWLSCMPWFLTGMVKPGLALGSEQAGRWQVFLRYAVALPFAAFLIWLTSLWGGFGPSLGGWLVGLVAVPAGLFLERRWLAAKRQRKQLAAAREIAETTRARRERFSEQQRETGLRVLDPARPPSDADELVLALCKVKGELVGAGRTELAGLADRIDGRYTRLRTLLAERFDSRELTFDRANSLVTDVSHAALDDLARLSMLAKSNAGMDEAFIRRRLNAAGGALSSDERSALTRRLDLLAEGESRIREQASRIEAALTALDDAALAVASLDTARPRTALKADEALTELRRFAATLKRYEQ